MSNCKIYAQLFQITRIWSAEAMSIDQVCADVGLDANALIDAIPIMEATCNDPRSLFLTSRILILKNLQTSNAKLLGFPINGTAEQIAEWLKSVKGVDLKSVHIKNFSLDL